MAKSIDTEVTEDATMNIWEWQDENNTLRIVHENHGDYDHRQIAFIFIQAMFAMEKYVRMLVGMDD